MPKREHSPAADNCRQRQGIKGRVPSLRLSSIHHETSYPEGTYLCPHERTALHLGSETLKLFLCIFSLPEKCNQTTLSCALSLCAHSLSPRSGPRRRCLWTSTSITGTRFTLDALGIKIAGTALSPPYVVAYPWRLISSFQIELSFLPAHPTFFPL